jgi:NADH dehydrogenase
MTFLTIEGHPLAGMLRFEVAPLEGAALRFAVEVIAQPADVLDWIAMHTVGGRMQSENWRKVVRRVAGISGGQMRADVQKEKRALTADETRAIEQRAEELVHRRQRAEMEQPLAP